VCPTCRLGYCQSCEKRGQNALVCPTCSNLCIAADDYANLEEGERLRARALVDDLGTIVGYPLRDPLGFVVLAVFIGLFGFAAKFAAFGRGFAILFSDGVLYSYAFYVVSRSPTVTSGRSCRISARCRTSPGPCHSRSWRS